MRRILELPLGRCCHTARRWHARYPFNNGDWKQKISEYPNRENRDFKEMSLFDSSDLHIR